MYNSFGYLFRLTDFGESHGVAMGGVIDGFPAGIEVDVDFVQHELYRRRPGQSDLTTPRNEADRVQFLSGIWQGKSTGAPIGFIVPNTNQYSADYDALQEVYRPSHADYTYQAKYGLRDHRGGGRASARQTLTRVVAGALAKLALKQLGVHIAAYTSQVGSVSLPHPPLAYDEATIEQNAVRCPDPNKAREMETLITASKAEGDTLGGTITCLVKGVPAGWGRAGLSETTCCSRLGHARHSCCQRLRLWPRLGRHFPERLSTKRPLRTNRKRHLHPDQSVWGHPRWHQQWSTHLLSGVV